MENNYQLLSYGYGNETEAMQKHQTTMLFSMKNASKKLGEAKGIGRNKLIKLLKEKKIIDNQNFATIEMVKAGFFVNRYRKINGVSVNVVYSTLSGLEKIKTIIEEL